MRRSEDNFDFETAAKLIRGEKIPQEDLNRFVHLASTSHSRAVWIEVEIYLNQEIARIREAEIILLKGLLMQEELRTQQLMEQLHEIQNGSERGGSHAGLQG